MAEKVLTMEDDWGAKGAQATGAQVQKFIKDQLQSLHDKDATLQGQIDALTNKNTDFQDNIDHLYGEAEYLRDRVVELANNITDLNDHVDSQDGKDTALQKQIDMLDKTSQGLRADLDPLIDASTGFQNQIEDLQNQIEDLDSHLHAATDGCFVVYTTNSTRVVHAVPWWDWYSLERAGEVADGVLVLIDGRDPIIVAPTQARLKWSESICQVFQPELTSYSQAYVDYTGKTRTAAIMAQAVALFGEEQENWIQYAPAWCNAYDRRHDKGNGTKIGIGPGKWWLPSIAELIIIWKHRYAINQCLSVITGSSPLYGTYYWSSTECQNPSSWCLDLGSGHLHPNAQRNLYQYYVRAVTAFH